MDIEQTEYLKIPSDVELLDRDSWSQVSRRHYSATQWTFAVRKQLGGQWLSGEPVRRLMLPAGAEYEVSQRDLVIDRTSYRIDEAVRMAVDQTETCKLAGEVSSSLGTDLSGIQAELASRVSSSLESTVKKALESRVGTTQTSVVEMTRELTRRVAIRAPGYGAQPRVIWVYTQYRPWYWDFFLVRVDYVSVEFSEGKLFGLNKYRNILGPIVHTPSEPLFRATVYEPQDWPAYREASAEDGDTFSPDVATPSRPEVGPAPDLTILPIQPFPSGLGGDVDALLSIPFPITNQEKKASKEHRRKAKAGKARKKTAKKSAKRSTGGVRKAAKKKGAKAKTKVAKKKVAKKKAKTKAKAKAKVAKKKVLRKKATKKRAGKKATK